ncbi:LuxR family transcriptional regulator [Streptomyces sp. NPDC047046]|uniref:LuxR family transcriptional regulator n=1 Tax=Streptomyces sp. NPDC047046 TaxID=3155378 RepID=UPI0034086F8A
MSDVGGTAGPAMPGLVGRGADLAFIRSFFGNPVVTGAALLLSGEAGVGKTAVLDEVAGAAERDGVRVLRAQGVQFEADIAYSGLNQLLLPLFASFDALEPVHRDALRVAVGIGSGPAPDRLLTSTAALLLLRQVSVDTPLLLVVDDLPWVDRATTAVLGFVARRLVGSHVDFLAACRNGTDSFFESSGLTEHRIEPLDSGAAAELLRRRHPDVSPAVRRRVAAEAHGNPLALVELPAALSGDQRTTSAALPSVLPLTERLQALFASRVAGLPSGARELLLLAALDGTGDLAAVEAAAAGRAAVEDITAAAGDRLVRISPDTRRISFRHPLMGSAVVEGSTTAERRRAHQSLADVLTDHPERRAWHLGEAAAGPDEEVAGLLEHAAHLRLRRGDALGAVAALIRAAVLSPRPAPRARRLAEAAYIGAEAGGELDDASRLLEDARSVDPGSTQSLHAAAASAFLLINRDGDIGTAHRLLVGAIESGAEGGHGWDAADPALSEALHTLVLLCWYGGEAALWQPLLEILDRLVPRAPDLLRVSVETFGDPARTGPGALPRLRELLAEPHEDPSRLARASAYADRLPEIREANLRLIEQGRAGTAPARHHVGALMHLGIDYYHLGRWDDAARCAAEGHALCEQYDLGFCTWYFDYVQAAVQAARGEAEAAAQAAERIVRWAAPRGAHGARYFALHALGIAALGSGDYESAYRHGSALTAPGTLAPFVPLAMWAAMDLVEAALRTGREEVAAAHAAAADASGMPGLSPRLRMLARASQALTTPGEAGLPLFEEALAHGSPRWPFDTARVRLAHGERLRRLRAGTEARDELTRALAAFQHLGAAPWAARAASELRAAGQAVPGATDATAVLTARERPIAQLAASGLTNKQIADRLFLSHRTIGTHLYQIYRKLGISSRAALRDALNTLDAPGTRRED